MSLYISPSGLQNENNVKKLNNDAPEVVSVEHFPRESSPDLTNNDSGSTSPYRGDEQSQAIAIATATAAAAEAAVAAAQAAAKVVRLAGYGRHPSREERSAILIQSHYRGYLVKLFENSVSLLTSHFVSSYI